MHLCISHLIIDLGKAWLALYWGSRFKIQNTSLLFLCMSKLKRKLDNGIECCMVQYTYAVYNAHAQNAGRLSTEYSGLDWHMQYKQ